MDILQHSTDSEDENGPPFSISLETVKKNLFFAHHPLHQRFSEDESIQLLVEIVKKQNDRMYYEMNTLRKENDKLREENPLLLVREERLEFTSKFC